MNQTVWKYTLDPYNPVYHVPRGAKILSVGAQNHQLCVWVLVEPGRPTRARRFEVYGTGHDISPYLTNEDVHLGTAQMDGLVFHVFERTEPPTPEEGT